MTRHVARLIRLPPLGRAAFHALFTLVITWPLLPSLAVGLPNGSETPGTVAYFNLWTMRWNQQQLGEGFRRYWDAPIFHPTPGAFALSEPQPLTGLVFSPISLATGWPVLAYNLVLLTAVTLNGLAGARLARRLGAGPWPAALAGVLAQALPFVTNELGVLQLVMVFPLLYLVDAIVSWAGPSGGERGSRPSWPRALAVGAWLSVTFLTCGYYGLFALVTIAPAAVVLVRRDWFSRRRLAQVAGAAALFAVVCGPILWGQARYTSEHHRSDGTIRALSAQPHHYLRLYEELPGASVTPWLSGESGERLYPGTALAGLAAAGAVVVARRPGGWPQRAPAVFVVAAGALAVLVSLGLHLSVFGWHPYALLRDHVPGFADLRSPFRAAVVMQALLVPLAGVALDRLWRAAGGGAAVEPCEAREPPEPAEPAEPAGEAVAPGGRVRCHARAPRWLGAALAVAVVVAGLGEVWPVPRGLVEAPEVGDGTDWVDWLAEHPEPGAGDGAVLMLPLPASGHYASFEDTTRWMLAGLDHGHPLVNGYSGLFPPRYGDLEDVVGEGFPSEAAVDLLAELGVSWVVAPHPVGGEEQEAYDAWADVLQPAFRGRDMVVYEVTASR